MWNTHDVFCPADGATLADAARIQHQPAHCRALAVLGRAVIARNSRHTSHDAPRLFSKAVLEIASAQQSISASDAKTPVVIHFTDHPVGQETVVRLLDIAAKIAHLGVQKMQPSPRSRPPAEWEGEEWEEAGRRRPGLQCDSCGVQRGTQRLFKCNACGWVWYCSSACQKKGMIRYLGSLLNFVYFIAFANRRFAAKSGRARC